MLRTSKLILMVSLLSLVLIPIQAEAGKSRKRKRKATPTAPVAATGTLVILSTNLGANLEIDGKQLAPIKGNQPKIKLSPGQHTIRVTLRGFEEYVDTFMVKAGEETMLEVDLVPVAGIVVIKTKPPGATVTVNGKVLGVTPFDRDIKAGPAVITITRAGYTTITKKLKLNAGKRYAFTDLKMSAQAPVTPAVSKAFYKTWWFWTVVGVVVAGSATATAVTLTGTPAKPPTADFSVYVP